MVPLKAPSMRYVHRSRFVSHADELRAQTELVAQAERVGLRPQVPAAVDEGGRLACTGYILDQSNGLEQVLRPGAREAPALGAYRTFQVPIEDIAQLTGLDLGPLVAADRYSVPRGARGVAQRWHEITGFADVAL